MTDDPISIREAGEDDLGVLIEFQVRISEHVAGVAPGTLRPSAEGRQQLHESMRAMLHDDDALVVVAVAADGRAIGMGDIAIHRHASVWRSPERWHQASGLIDDVWVEPEFRRQDVTRRIVAALVEFAADRGIEELVLEYSTANAEAAAAWSRLGFTPVGVRASARLADVAERL